MPLMFLLTTPINEFRECGYVDVEDYRYKAGICFIEDDHHRGSIQREGPTPTAALAELKQALANAYSWTSVFTRGPEGEALEQQVARHLGIFRQLETLVAENEAAILESTILLRRTAEEDLMRHWVLLLVRDSHPISGPDVVEKISAKYPAKGRDLIFQTIRRAVERREIEWDWNMRLIVGREFPSRLVIPNTR